MPSNLDQLKDLLPQQKLIAIQDIERLVADTNARLRVEASLVQMRKIVRALSGHLSDIAKTK